MRPAHGISPLPLLTAEGMAAYAGVMATFTGTSGNDRANATNGTLTGFTGGTVAQLLDTIGNTINADTATTRSWRATAPITINGGAGNDTDHLRRLGRFDCRRDRHRHFDRDRSRNDQPVTGGSDLWRHGECHRLRECGCVNVERGRQPDGRCQRQ